MTRHNKKNHLKLMFAQVPPAWLRRYQGGVYSPFILSLSSLSLLMGTSVAQTISVPASDMQSIDTQSIKVQSINLQATKMQADPIAEGDAASKARVSSLASTAMMADIEQQQVVQREGANLHLANTSPLRPPVHIKPPYTLWRLCTELTQDQSFDRYQLLVAIEALNPRAFVQHNVHKILPSQQLQLPSVQQVMAVDAQLAKQRVEADEALHRQTGEAATWQRLQLQSRQQVQLAWQNLTQVKPTQTTLPNEPVIQPHIMQDETSHEPQFQHTSTHADVANPTPIHTGFSDQAVSKNDAASQAQTVAKEELSKVLVEDLATAVNESQANSAVSNAEVNPQNESNLETVVSDDMQKADASSHRLEQQLGAYWRQYLQPGRVGQAQQQPRLTWQAELSWQSADDAQQVVIVPYLRWDGLDSAQHLADFHQAYWSWAGAGVELKVGVDKVFWGVTESQHLVDIINQTDMVARPDGEEKLGQPLLQMNYSGRWGTFQAYLLPYFRPREFAAADGRIRAPLPISDTPRYPKAAQNRFVRDYALRYYQQFDRLDMAISWFDGTAREPILRPDANQLDLLEAFYPQQQQLGLELQWLQGSWLWKLEAVERRQLESQYQAWVGGVEYSHVDAFSTGYDLGWLLEYQYDSRQFAATTPASRDMFAGLRLAFNDAEGSEFLLGLLQDLDFSQEQSLYLEGSTRLSDNMRLRLEAWLWRSRDVRQPLWWVAQDDYVQLGVDWYF
jgi:FimV-like protein